ncbi:hypothetical protein AYI68_g1936 [Smittium mucronatum]|uniref:ACT domain-containing protein n=1 Tax=Smittium mucronatum TaxID=133383 RepID=A0A1R0H460_9FUNG|nr:hypothetical protein AYI68_g1936 [Smittium mucronatum]
MLSGKEYDLYRRTDETWFRPLPEPPRIEGSALLFSIKRCNGGLDKCVRALIDQGVPIQRINTDLSKSVYMGYDFVVDLRGVDHNSQYRLVDEIKRIDICQNVALVRPSSPHTPVSCSRFNSSL